MNFAVAATPIAKIFRRREVAMLSQAEADRLMAMPKYLNQLYPIQIPPPGIAERLDARSHDGREKFIFDINRKGKRLKLTRCTFQERYAITEVLIRLDIDGPPHENPNGMEVPCPHIHVYREGFGLRWAESLPSQFHNPSNLAIVLHDFLAYCQVAQIPEVQGSLT